MAWMVSMGLVVEGGQFVLRVRGEQLLERQGARAVLGFQGLTGPGRNPRGEAGEKVVPGELLPGPAVSATWRREPFDPVGDVGEILRPLRAGLRAAPWWPSRTGGLAGKGNRGDRATKVQLLRGSATCGSTRATSGDLLVLRHERRGDQLLLDAGQPTNVHLGGGGGCGPCLSHG